jgi:hypothetical protein
MTGPSRGVLIQARDRRLLEELATMRLIDREQACRVAPFHSVTRANARMLALTRAGLLRRYFTGSIAGGRKAVYTLSREGAALVGAPFRVLSRNVDQTLAGDLFLQHQQALNAVYLALKFPAAPAPGVRLRRWLVFYEPPVASIPLTPDGYGEMETPQAVRPMFVEVDLGTEALRIWLGKARAYVQLATSGQFAQVFGQTQFRVLVVAPSERRLSNMRAAVAGVTDKIFWFAHAASINREGLWSAIWLRPVGDQRHSLL